MILELLLQCNICLLIILFQTRNAVSISLWKWRDHKIPYIIKESDFSK